MRATNIPPVIVLPSSYNVQCCDCSSQVAEVTETEVVCIARNEAVLGGLLTVFHTERSVSSLTNLQNELPVRATTPHICHAWGRNFSKYWQALQLHPLAERATGAPFSLCRALRMPPKTQDFKPSALPAAPPTCRTSCWCVPPLSRLLCLRPRAGTFQSVRWHCSCCGVNVRPWQSFLQRPWPSPA